MYISPLTPTGTSLFLSSSTYTLVLLIARPIGTFSPPPLTLCVLANVVLSVGPYPFITSHPSTSLFTFSQCLADTSSPPHNNCLTPFSASTRSSTTTCISPDVSHNVVTASLLICSPSCSTLTCPA